MKTRALVAMCGTRTTERSWEATFFGVRARHTQNMESVTGWEIAKMHLTRQFTTGFISGRKHGLKIDDLRQHNLCYLNEVCLPIWQPEVGGRRAWCGKKF